ncbi:MAG TPA: prephenate dehydrogenase [Peptococcaceae bacterium]|nr:prephenate dehydrogenase [Peptococcaceae bacterium]
MEESDFREKEITIVGLGLIGGSYAWALKNLKPKKIWAVDIDEHVLREAERLGAIDGGFREGRIPLAQSDLVIICVYPSAAVRFVQDNMPHFKTGAILTDAVGNKQKVIQEIRSFLRADLDFIGGHPLAGKEVSGFVHASAEIFRGANYLLTPVQGNKAESLSILEKLVRGLGCREPIYLSPEEHDKIIAFTSQLPHVMAAALANSCQISELGKFIGGSFRDATRVARMNATLWAELLLDNKENILTELDIFRDNIAKFQSALKNDNKGELESLLRKSASIMSATIR